MKHVGTEKQIAVGVIVNTPHGRGVVTDGPNFQPREQKWTCSVRISDIQHDSFYCDQVTPIKCEEPHDPWLQELIKQFLNELV
jgi:hypothetical protein